MAAKERPLFYQRVNDFPDFPSYLEEWLIPSVLGDIETVFEGATRQWETNQQRARGNFVLATALFAVMDHIGAFLQSPADPESTWRNISLCAQQLPSLCKVHSIMAICGRNSLVHGAWPQTMLVIQDGPKEFRFGLNISAEADTAKEHHKLYWKEYSDPREETGLKQPVLKLRLNVYALLSELGNWLRSRNMSVDPLTFERIRDSIGQRCYYTVVGDTMREGKPHSLGKNRGWSKPLLNEVKLLFSNAPDFGEEVVLPIPIP